MQRVAIPVLGTLMKPGSKAWFPPSAPSNQSAISNQSKTRATMNLQQSSSLSMVSRSLKSPNHTPADSLFPSELQPEHDPVSWASSAPAED
jgi:hypothetical protein